MANNNLSTAATPDLASILQSLAAFSKQQQDQVQPPATQPLESAPYSNQQGQNHEAIQGNPANFVPQQPYPTAPQQFPPQHQYPPQHQHPVSQNQYAYPPHAAQNFGPQQQFQNLNQGPNLDANRKIIDPATIVDWPSGLRCVMRTVAKHDQILYEIRRMIKTQHEHEDQWWDGRKALQEKQSARKEGREKLAAVLRSVGSTAPTKTASESEIAAEEAEELRIFDTKVYRAQLQMVKEMSTKLKSMGVPFFGTRSELVRVGGRKDDGGMGLDGASEDQRADDDGKIDEENLVGLQRKMLGMLEDLCKG